MPEHLLSGIGLLATPGLLPMLVLGVVVGLAFGILPGLSGLSALAVLLPFIYGFGDAFSAVGFLLGAHAAVYAGGSVTSILLGIPGSPGNAATVLDGHAMYRDGRGGEAIGAALFASACGGLLGAAVLVVLLPLLQPVVLSFGAPEIFLVALLGIVWASVCGQGPPLHALIAAGVGMVLASFGYQRSTGVPRFWFDFDYLLDGIRLVPLVLGLFAVPEIVALSRSSGRGGAERPVLELGSLWRGVRAVLLRPLLFVRSSVIGVLVGIVPGVGGETAPFLAHAAAGVDRGPGAGREGFVEGVIAPESSNNAKEGGSLVPTLALGIPGSASMAMLLGAFLVFGLEPGPDFLVSHLDMAAGLGLILALTNVLAALLMIPLALLVARLVDLPGRLVAPVLVVLVIIGAWFSSGDPIDVAFVLLFGLVGMVMVRYDFSRPLLVLGFILAPIVETYLQIAFRAYGWSMFQRPMAAGLAVLIVVALLVRLPWAGPGRRRGSRG